MPSRPVIAFIVSRWRLTEVPRSSGVRLLRETRQVLGLDPRCTPFVAGVHFEEDHERLVVITQPARPEPSLVRQALTLIEAKHRCPVRQASKSDLPPLTRGEAGRRKLEAVEVWPPEASPDEQEPVMIRFPNGGLAHRDYAQAEVGWLIPAQHVEDAYIFASFAEAAAWLEQRVVGGHGEILYRAALLADHERQDAEQSANLYQP